MSINSQRPVGRRAAGSGERSSGRLSARRVAAVGAGKLTALASRALGRGGGTALPGVVATRLNPTIARELAGQLDRGSILVSGTNGKTTTARMLNDVLTAAGLIPVRNDAGSNLMRGIASSLIRESSVTGNLPRRPGSIGVFEVDEAAFPDLAIAMQPRAILLLDLFRDQLDRYGEVATVARLWTGALARLDSSTRLVVNADDPLLVETAHQSALPPLFFGIESASREAGMPEHASDVKACPRCGGRIEYSRVFLGHLGHFACRRCELRRPEPWLQAENVELRGLGGSSFVLRTREREAPVHLPLPGLYNVYNAVAAAAMAHSIGVSLEQVADSLGRVTPAFGRMETLSVEGRTVYLALAKNPAGLNEVIRTVTEDDGPAHLLVMLNDNTADGHDVSWIWDADIEMLAGRVASLVFGGTRAADMALRFKYADVITRAPGPGWEIAESTESGFRRALSRTPRNGRLVIIPTYTAMLDLRATLTRLGYVKPYWESQ